MGLYPKKLNSIEDLEREKKLLRNQMQQLDNEEFLSFDGILGNKGASKNEEGSGSLFDLLSFLPASNPLIDMVVNKAQSWFAGRSSKADDHKDDRSKKSSSPIRAIAVEVIGGYLKWKAVELSFKGIRHIIKVRRERRQEQ